MATPKFDRRTQQQADPPGKSIDTLDCAGNLDRVERDRAGAESGELIDDADHLVIAVEPAFAFKNAGKLVQDLEIDAHAFISGQTGQPFDRNLPLFGIPDIVHV